ncbi:MAG: acetolactate decarboxylase [Prolixibacteraceae bacterium]|jgi:acetolactate decarboxylase|nr:acetolactate decarboxylase [Prolixibacteraceae bacterium]
MNSKAKNRYFILHPSFYLIIFLLIFSCSKEKEQEQQLVQVSTIDALMQGVYDGTTPLSELGRHGDFGIGTFHALDGEMILLNDIFYQVKADGKVYQPEKNVLTPFATVTFFNPEIQSGVTDMSYPILKKTIDSLMISPNLFCAIKLHGTFNRVKTRSVPAQQKPYRPLVEVTASQPEFEAQSITGTLSGFYCPPFVTGINVPGYHLHFLSDDHTFGGHVLEIELVSGELFLDQINDFRLILPEEGGFLDTDLTNDLSGDLEEVEGGK